MKKLSMNLIALHGLAVFAYDPQAKPAQNTDSGDLSAGMQNFYSKYMLERMLPELVYAQFGEKEPLPEKRGKTIVWRQFTAYKAASILIEGVTPDPETLTETKVEATIVQIGAFTPFTDLVDLTHPDPVVSEVVQLHSEQAPFTVDVLVRNELCGATNVFYAPIVEGDATVEITARDSITNLAQLTPKVIAKVATFLRKQNAKPIDGKHFAMVVHPSVAHDIMLHPDWIDAQKYKEPEKIYNHELGTFRAFRFFESTNARVTKDGSGGASVYDSIALGKGAFKVVNISGLKIIVKQVGSSGSADPIDQRGTVGFKIPGFACKVTRPGAICRVVSGASSGDEDDAN